ncbi:hypothetical protein QR721_10480 [Aciduricibacillus chroicocephali]|uniref:Uncharacterized protein n=1 Tax=Aciduricibacillus chroicocephali TaxID=3054939 RepID=A0ABY9KTC4_9BACI|nr:hypothetical protein QR721_10480 [Bacillaceae bacterium 44XB]
MIESVFTIGGVLIVISIILGLIILKATPKSAYLAYAPGAILFAGGLVLLLLASIMEKTVIMGAGLGGWGMACLFAAAFGFIVTSTADAFAQEA